MLTKSTQLGNPKIPKLRFSDFSGEWEEKKLSSFLIPELREVPKPSQPYMAIGIRSHFKGTFQKLNSDPDKIAMEELFLVQENDFIVNITFAWEGALAIVKKEDGGGLVSHRFPTYVFDKAISSPNYFRYVFPTKRMRYMLDVISPGGAGRNRVLNKKDLLNIKINLPSVLEQEKITEFLEFVDKWIENLREQKKTFESYKKGMIQKLFSQEVRFKDNNGKSFPKWDMKKIGDVLKIGSGKDYKHLEYGNVPVFGSGGYMLSVNKKIYSGETVFIGRKGTIDKPFYFNGDFWVVDTLFYMYGFNGIYPKFTSYVFQRINWKKYNEASGVPSLSKATIEKIKIDIPTLIEQQKIADFLTSIDKVIESKQQQIVQAELWKKALMQRLFI